MIILSSAIPRFLNAFQCDPFDGRMQIPIAARDAQDPSGFQVSSLRISPDPESRNAAMAASRQMIEEMDSFLAGSHRRLIPHTDHQWAVTRMPIKRRVLFFEYLGQEVLPWNKIVPQEKQITFIRKADDYREINMCWTIQEAGEEPESGFAYIIDLNALGLLGLRNYLQLPSNIHIEALRTSLFDLLNAPQAQREAMYELDRIFTPTLVEALDLGDRYWRIEEIAHLISAELENDQTGIIVAQVRPEDDGFTERMIIQIDYGDGSQGPYRPLPTPLKGLWNWVTSEKLNLSPGEDLQTYRTLTKALYRTGKKSS